MKENFCFISFLLKYNHNFPQNIRLQAIKICYMLWHFFILFNVNLNSLKFNK